MKQIQKQQEPQLFTEWKAQANDDWQPDFGDLGGDEKQAVKQALMREQGEICCYCERRLTDDDSHIEHFRPQSDPDVDSLDFGNMLCSCQNRLQRGEPRHCGNSKSAWFDKILLISPLDAGCESRFAYNGDGHIKPKLDADGAASETIRRLALDIPKLRALRAAAITPFLDDSLTEADVRQFVGGYLQSGPDGKLGEFWTSISYLFQEYVAA
ncbi:MAG: TIGR02646 family protein [Candidatus Thiodiazotropha sp. (ex Rostrolucina anterorostrata)]|nr:TIGR02646 family protein [Candidatus Thiodiazotropha sp. (ex Rostrolucina anterorostrata)]